MYKILVFILVILFPVSLSAAELRGYIYEKNTDGTDNPLYGVSVYWSGTTTGAVTEKNGWFKINKVSSTSELVIRYVGYKSDTLTIPSDKDSISILLSKENELQAFVLTESVGTSFISKVNPMTVEIITGAELHKAACCNLGESFETNASVDVSYGDAVSGAKKIELLGLAGIYSQILLENMPDQKGFGRTFGLSYIPGHWLESISVSKGASSVTSGNESITGQISVDYKKPDGDEIFYLNLYGASFGKFEANTNVSKLITDEWSTMILGHYSYGNTKLDLNDDGFVDVPLINQYHLMNRWKYQNKKKTFMTQFAFGALKEDRTGGQLDYDPEAQDNSGIYGFNVATTRYHGFWKGGYAFQGRKATNFAFINNMSWQDQQSVFGLNKHTSLQLTSYHAVTFGTYLGNTNHTIRTGLSYVYGDFEETLNGEDFLFTEKTPGVFGEYTYKGGEKVTLMTGLRGDFHNVYGFQFTPRAHFRYKPNDVATIRVSAGKGYRTPHLFAENLFILATSKEIEILDKEIFESAWNYGVHVSHDIKLFKRKASLNIEFYRTDFQNQMVIDMDSDIHKVYIYNLVGKSFANNYQTDLKFEPIKRLEVLLAARYSDVKVTVNDELVRKPFSKQFKGLINLSYATKLKKWQFDFTAQMNGKSRLPENTGLPSTYATREYSPAYTIINTQVARYFRHWNVYVGVENLTNFTQKNPIIAVDDPFGAYFDASQVWGPVIGRKFYIGMRYTIKRG